MKQFNLIPGAEPSGESIVSYMTKCALLYSIFTAVISVMGALHFKANALAIWGFLTVPVLLALLLIYVARPSDGHPENGHG